MSILDSPANRGHVHFFKKESGPSIRRDLAAITPLRQGVAFAEVFNMLWQYFFGYANRYMAEAGLITDTYRDPADRTGFLPALIYEK